VREVPGVPGRRSIHRAERIRIARPTLLRVTERMTRPAKPFRRQSAAQSIATLIFGDGQGNRPRRIYWLSETPTKLYAKLTAIVGKKVAVSANWPEHTEKFGDELRRLAPQLRMHGLNVSFERRHEGRIITWKSERAPIVPPEVGRR
jgi:hypothetical protein